MKHQNSVHTDTKNIHHYSDSDSDFEIVAITHSKSDKIQDLSVDENQDSFFSTDGNKQSDSVNEKHNNAMFISGDNNNGKIPRNEVVNLSNEKYTNSFNENFTQNDANDPMYLLQSAEQQQEDDSDIVNLSDYTPPESMTSAAASLQEVNEVLSIRTNNPESKNDKFSWEINSNLDKMEHDMKRTVEQKINIAIENEIAQKDKPATLCRELVNVLSDAREKYSLAIQQFQQKKVKLLTTKTVLERKLERKVMENDNLGAEKIKLKLRETEEQISKITIAISPVSSLFMFYQNAIKDYELKIRQLNIEKNGIKSRNINFFDKAKEEFLGKNKILNNTNQDYKIRQHISNFYSGVEQPQVVDPVFASKVDTNSVDPYILPPPTLRPTKTQGIDLLETLDLENNGFNIEVVDYKNKKLEKANQDLKMKMLAEQRPELKHIAADFVDDGENFDLDMEKVSEPHFLPDQVLEHLTATYFSKQGMIVQFSELIDTFRANIQQKGNLLLSLSTLISVPKFLVFNDPIKYPFDFDVILSFLESLNTSIYSGVPSVIIKIFYMYKVIGGLLIRCRYASYINYLNCNELRNKYNIAELSLKESKNYNRSNGTFTTVQAKNQYFLLQRKIKSVLKFNALYNLLINKLHASELKLRSMGFPQLPDVTTILNNLQFHRRHLMESKISTTQKDAINTAGSLLKFDDNVTSAGRNITADDLRQLEKLVDEIKTADAKDEINTPFEMSCVLMKHQKIGLFRLNHLEKSSSKGGILGDEMGLGKTIQMIALMLLNKQDVSLEETDNLDGYNEFRNKKAPTLIVAPVSLLHNWNFEIESKIKKEFNLSVTTFHESNKPSKFDDLRKFDVVLTSYGTLYSEYRKHLPESIDTTHNTYVDFSGENRKLPALPTLSFLSTLKRKSEYISPFYEQGAMFYRIILDEAHEIKNTATGKSKACCILSSQYRWCLTGTPVQNNVYDIYALLRFLRIRPYMKEIVFKEKIGKYLDLKKNKQSPSSSVESKRRAERHLQALVARISLRRTKGTEVDGKKILELPELNDVKVDAKMGEEERLIYSQLEANIAEEARIVMNNPRSPMARKRPIFTLLLRLRQACIHYVLVKIGEIHREIRDLADFTYEEKWLVFKSFVERQPLNVTIETNKFLQGQEGCGSCKQLKNASQINLLQSLYNPRCGHCICIDCFDSYCEINYVIDDATKNVLIKCPLCSTQVLQQEWIPTKLFDLIHNQAITDDMYLKKSFDNYIDQLVETKKTQTSLNMDELPVSCKIQQTLDIIKKIKKSEPNAKVLIFSSFTYFFKILSYFVESQLNMKYTQFDGMLNVHQKSAAIDEFRDNPDCNLLFISLKAGNVGLTLTMAHHVILVDPYWNPSVEDQAIGRAHRISQNRPVQVHRLLIENTVEDRILTIQQRKKALAGSILDSENMSDIATLGRRELGYLFGLNQLDDNRVSNDTIGEASSDL